LDATPVANSPGIMMLDPDVPREPPINPAREPIPSVINSIINIYYIL
jgi:hypothetical protein